VKSEVYGGALLVFLLRTGLGILDVEVAGKRVMKVKSGMREGEV